MSFETKLEKYARLIVQSGLNVQEKQTVVISASIESYQLVREVTKQAYLVGAKEVVVHYSDEEVTRMKYENMEVEDFNHVPTWFSSFRNDYALMNACFLYVDDEDPEQFIEDVGKLLDKLPEKRKIVLELCVIESKSYAEIAELLGISLNTVKDHVKKAYAFLREELRKEVSYPILFFALYFKGKSVSE